jgi:parallel beta-helix repeat protein
MKNQIFLPALSLLAACSFLSASVHAGVVLSGGGLTLVEEGGTIASGNLAASGTAFAKDLLPGFPAHTISNLNDQLFGNGESWIGNSTGTFAGISLGATPVTISSIAFGRDNTIGGFTDRTLGLYTLQYTTQPNPTDATTAWTTIGTLSYGAAGGTNYASPSKRHRYFFNPVAATGIRLLVPAGGLAGGTCIDELEVYASISVTTTADSGAGSLRQAILDAAAASGPTHITFAPALSGQTITLNSEIVISDAAPVAIDASSLPAGITINGGPGTNRIFYINSGNNVFLTALTLTGGQGGGATFSGDGGAISNRGTLTLTSCTLFGNSATMLGGAIDNFLGTLSLSQCTLSGNSVGDNGSGGAIYNSSSTLTLTHCTLSGNSVSDNGSTGSGGAIFNSNAQLNLTNTLIADNFAIAGPDIYRPGGTITPAGTNLIGDLADSGLSAGPGVIVGAPLLGPLADHGGPTRTMALLSGSPALDAAIVLSPALTADQRGFPRNRDGNGIAGSLPDIGAYEAQAAPTPAMPNPILVTTLADENDPNGNPGAGLSLREAVRLANAGATIGFDPSLSGQSIVLTLGSEIVLGKNVSIDASSLPNGITIDGGAGSNRIFSIPAGQVVTLKHMTLTGGGGTGATGSGRGGAIHNASSSLTLTDCSFQGNSASFGGGIYNAFSSPTINNFSLQGNSSTTAGGGIFNTSSSPTLTNCSFQGNSATSSGGGIYNASSSSPTFTNCSFQGNSATSSGGGIYNASSSPTLTNCSFQGNSTSNLGGGIYNASSSPTLTNCSLQGNSVTISGGAIYNSFSSPTFTNCILWRNKDNSGIGTASSSVANSTSSNPTYSHCLIQGLNPAGTGNLDGTLFANDPLFVLEVDPNLAPVTGGDLRLRSGSPAMDAGSTASNPTTTDLAGRPRKVGGSIDLGAYEFQRVFVNVAVSGGSQNGTSWANAFTHLQSALAAAQSGDEIWVATGTYHPDLGTGQTDNARSSTFALKAGVALYGGFAGTETTLSQRNPATHPTILSGDLLQNDGANFANNADNAYHVLTATGATITSTTLLDGFTITAGNANGAFNETTRYESGGGLFCSSSASPTVNRCSFVGNNALNSGGGIFNNFASPTLTHCSFQGNRAASGGGIYNFTSSPTLTHCSFQGNSATSNGGGIYNFSISSPTLTNCSFQGNSASFEGGGIVNSSSSSPTLTNCSFQGNSAASGGGIYNGNSSPTLNNCILWRNKDNSGTGTANSSVFNSSSTPTYSHCLIQGLNPAGTGNLNGTLSSNNPLFVREVDPNLAPVTGGDLRLLAGSPALDTGNNAANTSNTDLAGNPRKVGTIDLGAYEGAFVTFAHLGYTNPSGDANGNGISNFGDYAAGGNPNAPDDPTLRPKLIGNQLTFSFRDNAADISKQFQKSTTLLPGSWQQLIENTDYTVTTTTSSGGRSLQTLTLTNALRSTNPKLFFRAAFESVP